jgi:hypothetical protein
MVFTDLIMGIDYLFIDEGNSKWRLIHFISEIAREKFGETMWIVK